LDLNADEEWLEGSSKLPSSRWSFSNVSLGLILLKNSTQRNSVQNIGTFSPQIGSHETVFAKAGYRGKKFSEFDHSESYTEFFNTIGSMQSFDRFSQKAALTH